jgi:hypothetical protein
MMTPTQLAAFVLGWSCTLIFGGICGYTAIHGIDYYGWWSLPTIISAAATTLFIGATDN